MGTTEGWIVMRHWDALTKIGGIGLIARDSAGRILGGLNRRVRKHGATMLEVLAIMEGTWLAIERGWRVVVLELDSEAFIKRIQSNDSNKRSWRIRPIIDNITISLKKFHGASSTEKQTVAQIGFPNNPQKEYVSTYSFAITSWSLFWTSYTVYWTILIDIIITLAKRKTEMNVLNLWNEQRMWHQ